MERLKLEGKGRLYLLNGNVCKGEFSSNLYNGQGILYFKDGSVLDGHWINGDAIGNCTFKYPN